MRLVCEYCDKGSLREALDLGAFTRPNGSINYPAVLDTAIEIATAVAHLHHRNVLHSDLKVWIVLGCTLSPLCRRLDVLGRYRRKRNLSS